ncbi:MAG: hypothetical protein K2X47_20010, partial [Bdellovibrionales bacterium]|nr:hypothetical protein [Bdellovibrionales bacterium]
MASISLSELLKYDGFIRPLSKSLTVLNIMLGIFMLLSGSLAAAEEADLQVSAATELVCTNIAKGNDLVKNQTEEEHALHLLFEKTILHPDGFLFSKIFNHTLMSFYLGTFGEFMYPDRGRSGDQISTLEDKDRQEKFKKALYSPLANSKLLRSVIAELTYQLSPLLELKADASSIDKANAARKLEDFLRSAHMTLTDLKSDLLRWKQILEMDPTLTRL